MFVCVCILNLYLFRKVYENMQVLRSKRRLNQNTKWIAIFLAPTVFLFLLIYLYPMIMLITISFTNFRVGFVYEFTGLENYIQLFTKDNVFLVALKNTGLWLLLQWFIHVPLGILLALLVRANRPFMRFVRVTYMVPNQISSAALAMLLFYIFKPGVSPFNALIRIFVPGFDRNWFFDMRTAFFTVTISTIFYAGVICLLAYTEMTSISESIFDSAKIDGATDWAINFRIILPMIKNIIATGLILSTTGALNSFEVIMLTTNGGPMNATMNLPLYLYRNAMTGGLFGYGNAIGIIILLIGLVLVGGINKVMSVGKSDLDII